MLFILIRPLDFSLEIYQDSIHLHRFLKKNPDAVSKMKSILLPRNCFQFALENVIVSKILYTSLDNTKNEHFFNDQPWKSRPRNFSISSDVLYQFKTLKGLMGVSIAPTPVLIRPVQATNGTNEKRRNMIAPAWSKLTK